MTKKLPCLPVMFSLLLAASAFAADEHFDGSAYDGKGGFAPVSDPAYAQECGACHFAFSPGLLPASSWEKLLSGLNNHFGESLALSPADVEPMRAYLLANAADVSDYKGSEKIMETMPESDPPTRITRVPHIYKSHIVLRWLYKGGRSGVQHRTFTNCQACHRRAGEGSWALDELVVPGLTKVIETGDMF